MTDQTATRASVSKWPPWLRRGRCETVAMILIGLGIVMLMQPLFLSLYSYSFVTILAGTLGFVIVSHFPD
jgi:hypothetical protein